MPKNCSLTTLWESSRFKHSEICSKTLYIHPDHLGSTNVVTDQNDNLVQTLDYFPYGGTRVSVSSSTNEQRKYVGQFADQSGLSYLNARYYERSRGQFLSQDPLFVGDPKLQLLRDHQSLNSYSYSDDNPITKSDPNGRSALTGGFDGSAWNATWSFGLSIDQYGIDYYYGWGIAAGVHAGANIGITTDNLPHAPSVTTSAFGALGDVYGGEVSYGMTQYPNTKKSTEESMVMTGGMNFGNAAGVRSVKSSPLLVWGSRPRSTLPTTAELLAQKASVNAGMSWSLPATVAAGGTTYYRNYSGLLSTTAAQSTSAVIGSSIKIAGNSNSAGSAPNQQLFELHAIVPK